MSMEEVCETHLLHENNHLPKFDRNLSKCLKIPPPKNNFRNVCLTPDVQPIVLHESFYLVARLIKNKRLKVGPQKSFRKQLAGKEFWWYLKSSEKP